MNWLKKLFGKHIAPKPSQETVSQRVDRMRKSIKHNPTTGEPLITRRYKDACIDEVLEHLRRLS